MDIGFREKLLGADGRARRRAAVIGIGVTNVPLIRFLAATGAHITACDRRPLGELGRETSSLSGLDIEYRTGQGYLDELDTFDIVYLSPGVNPNQPEIERAKAAGVEFSSEIDLVLRLSKAPVIGITGSSGKTTTTTLTGLVLKEDARRHHPGRTVYVGGNIGSPLIEQMPVVGRDDLVVLELSSFQLKPLTVSPHIGAVLNITPNHLDVHPDMQDYIAAKENIVRHRTARDWAVFGIDNDQTAAMARRDTGKKALFSVAGPVPRGAYLDGDMITLRWSETEHDDYDAAGPGGADPGSAGVSSASVDVPVIARQEIRIPGMHNVQNVLAAAAICRAAGADVAVMGDVVRSFEGVEHRLEPVGEVDGIAYVNDSIATTPARTMAALLAADRPIVLIAGGYDKHLPFDEMAELALGRVKCAVLIGVTADKIEKAFVEAAERKGVDHPRIVRETTFEAAVEAARDAAEPGDMVLLSPACASYGMFTNFTERGRRFKEIVSGFRG